MVAAVPITFDPAFINREYRIFGPPGTGKTETIKRLIRELIERDGVNPSRIFVSSFTRTAAENLVGRGLAIPPENIRTLHAMGFRALGGDKIIAEQRVREWNALHSQMALSVSGGSDEDTGEDTRGGLPGDKVFSSINIQRARMKPVSLWDGAERRFWQAWQAWKAEKGYIDFTDMIELPLKRGLPLPIEADYGFFDEFQDFSKLEAALVRHWGSTMTRRYLAGDDDQVLFRFKGAEVKNFIEPPIPDEQRIYLRQSYRVPRRVQEYATKWITRVDRREEKAYHARDAEGDIRWLRDEAHDHRSPQFTWSDPASILETLMPYTAQGKRVMVIASCAYMLEPLTRHLKGIGVPFSNPYRPNRSEWNPLVSTNERTSSTDRLLAFLRLSESVWGVNGTRIWTPEDFRLWTDVVRATGVFKRGAKAAFDRWYDSLKETDPSRLDQPMDAVQEVMTYLEPDAFQHAAEQDVAWFSSVLLEGREEGMRFPMAVTHRYGAERLRDDPQIMVGTIHSVKGGEADVVVVFPDLSKAGHDEWIGTRPQQDSLVRLFYVAMTRARETLIFAKPRSTWAVDFPNRG